MRFPKERNPVNAVAASKKSAGNEFEALDLPSGHKFQTQSVTRKRCAGQKSK
jgi:hypothetical protein